MGRCGAAVVVAVAAATAGGAPVREADPVLVGATWKGTLTQKGTFAGGGAGPPRFRTTLTVTARDGAAFEADLREQTDGLDITYLVRGEVARAADGRGYAVTFRSVGAKNVVGTAPILGVPYAGRAVGRMLTGAWRYGPPDGGTAIEGEFDLRLSR